MICNLSISKEDNTRSYIIPSFSISLSLRRIETQYIPKRYFQTVFGYGCNVTQGQLWLSQGTLDVLVVLFGIRTCTLDVLGILFGIIWLINDNLMAIAQLTLRQLMN